MIIDVTDLDFEMIDFKRRYDTAREKRAKTLYNHNDVTIQSVDKIDNNHYKILARVYGNYDTYTITLEMEENVIQNSRCTCEDYKSGNICKHIIATCMEIIEPHHPNTLEKTRQMLQQRMEEQKKKQEYERKYANALFAINQCKREEKDIFNDENINYNIKDLYEQSVVNKMQREVATVELATSIKIETHVEIQTNSSIEVTFKMGQTTMYVVKDLVELYNAFEKGKMLQYGKKLRFIAKKENFCEEEHEILDFILEYGKILKYSRQQSRNSYYYSPTISTKTVNLDEDRIDAFFNLVKNKTISISGRSLNKSAFVFSNNPLDIYVSFEKEENSEDYVAKINLEENYEYLESNRYIYVLYNEKIYSLEKKNNNNLEDILRIFKYHQKILIPSDKIDEFSTYVLPKINSYMRIENLPAEIAKEGVLVHRLASKMYLDLDDKENIILELKFCYGNHEFNVLDRNYERYIQENNIIRNIPEEREVLTRIFTDGFELGNGKRYFTLKDIDDTYEFLAQKVETYMNDFEVLVTDKFKNKKVRKAKVSNVSVKLENGLLEVDISKLDIDINEIQNILKNYSIKKRYYKLKSGDFLNLEQSEDLEFLNDMSNNLDVNYDKLKNGIIKLPVNRSIYLEKLLDKSRSIHVEQNDEFTTLVNNVENKNFSDSIKIDKNFENVLRDYQKVGYKWLKVLEHYKFGGILADDMGLGKTLQVIALLSSEQKGKNKKPSIVVCPSSLVLNWRAEVEKWCKEIRVLIIKGDLETRKSLIDSYEQYDLVITSYDLLKRDILEYENKNFKYIIADEAQYIKNSATQNATALKSLEGEIKFALTGTPIENSVAELWSIFDFIMPGYLYTYNKFKKKFEEPILKSEDVVALQKLKSMINPFILRRVKKDVLTELPEKNITIMNSEMTKEQEQLYISYLAQTKKEVAEELSENGFEKSKFKILMLLTRLRQICCHPSLFIDNYTGESGKLNQCIDIICDAIEAGHKILLFSGYTSMFEIIEEKLKQKNINYYKLTGNTQVDKRVAMVEQFNKDDNIKIFLISLKAGGTGLNLTGADVVIHYDPWWNISSENQATDRAYRIGQKNSVQVYKLITTNSIEEKINKLQEKKAKLSEQILSTEETFINKLSKEEIMALFE